MDAFLVPWFSRADALYADWRDVLHGGCGGALDADRRRALTVVASHERTSLVDCLAPQETSLDDAQQLEFRELLEILALAWRVDAPTCVALACEGMREKTLLSAEPVRPKELLRLSIDASVTCESVELLRAFFGDWTEATASDAFKQSKQELLRLYDHGTRGQRLELALRLGRWGEDLKPTLRLLGRIDRSVFRVKQITVTIQHVTQDVEDLTELFRLLHGFRDEADVRIRLQMSHDVDDPVRLCDWKPVFDLIARRQFPIALSGSKKNKWDIEVSCGGVGFGDDTDDAFSRWNVVTHARLVAACYSALAHAADHVTSIHLIHPLEDKTSDLRPPVGRRVRARWLGYLLRTSAVDSLTIDETELSIRDLEEISKALEAPNREECLRRLWKEEWSRSGEGKCYAFGSQFVHIEDPEKYLWDPDQVLGVMTRTGYHATTRAEHGTGNPYADIFLVGYGQCSVQSSHMALVEAMKEATERVPEAKAQLKALTIRLHDGARPRLSPMLDDERSDVVLLRLLALIGSQLEDLTFDAIHLKLDVATLAGILRACPNLRRLKIKYLDSEASGGDQVLSAPSLHRHPLETLSVEIKPDAISFEIEAFCKCLMVFGVEIRDFRVRGDSSRGEVDDSSQRAMNALLRSCFQSCLAIEVVRFPIEYFREIFKQDTIGFPKLETLIVKDVFWSVTMFRSLVSALSTPTHTFAQSLRTLAIRTTRFSQYGDALIADMLESNRSLVNFRFATSGLWRTRMGGSGGIKLERLKTPLSKRQKAALLSVLEASLLPWESFVVAKIFRFVIEPEIRQTVVTMY